jgi:hypothetical protein
VISPNPFTNSVLVRFHLNENSYCGFKIIDQKGSAVLRKYKDWIQKRDNKISLNTSNLSSGIYLLGVETNSEFIRQKIIKIN